MKLPRTRNTDIALKKKSLVKTRFKIIALVIGSEWWGRRLFGEKGQVGRSIGGAKEG